MVALSEVSGTSYTYMSLVMIKMVELITPAHIKPFLAISEEVLIRLHTGSSCAGVWYKLVVAALLVLDSRSDICGDETYLGIV